MKHYIIFKCNDKVSDISAFVCDAERHFARITDVPGVHAYRVIEGIRERENRYHAAIEIEMDRSALPAYDASECHHEWKEKFGPFIDKKAIFDCE